MRPYPQANDDVTPVNVVLNNTTSPARWDLRPGEVWLATIWIQWLTVIVEDQFEEVLHRMYQGAEVHEKFGRKLYLSINQRISEVGTYLDPVGIDSSPAVSEVLENSNAARDWPSEPTEPMRPADNVVQRFAVTVGGHSLEGGIRRRLFWSPPNRVEVRWP